MMASALAQGLSPSIIPGEQVSACDLYPAALTSFASKVPGSFTSQDMDEVIKRSDVVFLCTKPQQIPEALAALNKSPEISSKLVISIVIFQYIFYCHF
jgi:pyrroline-5-carboxylate reductase